MAGRGSRDGSAPLRELAEELVVALVGAATGGGRRIESVLAGFGERGGVRREDVSDALRELGDRWRGESVRVSERAASTLTALFRELGLATREDLEELELRLAQLEHRLRLLERSQPPSTAP